MNKKELIKIILNGENEKVEFKNSFQKKVIIEKYGSGIKRVIEEFENYGLPKPEFKANNSDFYVTVFLTAQKSIQDRILALLKDNPKYTKNDLMKILERADGTIKEHLSKLKKNGKLKRVGGRKTGYWEVTDK